MGRVSGHNRINLRWYCIKDLYLHEILGGHRSGLDKAAKSCYSVFSDCGGIKRGVESTLRLSAGIV